MNDALRPRSIAELLDHTVELYRRHFVLLFGIPALAIVPVVCLVLLLPGILSVIAALLMVWLLLMAAGAMSYAVVRLIQKEPVTILDAWKAACQRWLNVTVAAALVVLCVGLTFVIVSAGGSVVASILSLTPMMVGGLLALALGIVNALIVVAFSVLFVMAPTAVMAEGIDGITAMRRSIALGRANWRHMWACHTTMLVFAAMITYVLSFVGVMIFSNLGMTDGVDHHHVVPMILQVVLTLTGLLSLLLVPLQLILTGLLYVDARIRLEGFDIQLLAERFGDRVSVRSAESDGAV